MTFTNIRQAVLDYCNLSSDDAKDRVGKSVNRHYRRITASIGLDVSRFVTRSAVMSVGVRTVTFADIEKIDRVIDTSDSTAIRPLREVSIDHQRKLQPSAGQPETWAFQNADADAVTILTDTIPQVAYTLQADGWTTLADIHGNSEPAFPASYHDILIWFVIAEELLKKEKDKLAKTYESKADKLLSELRFALQDSYSRTTVQGGDPHGMFGGGGGGGGGNTGGSAYTQTSLLTFDLGAGVAPFAVAQDTAPYVVNLGAEFLGNIATDRLVGRDTSGTGESQQLTVGGGVEFTGSLGIQRSALTGDVTAPAGSSVTTLANLAVTTGQIADLAVTTPKIADLAVTTAKLAAGAATYAKVTLTDSIVNADVNTAAAIAWTKISKTGSSLADLTTRSASDLSTGTLAADRLPTGAVRQVVFGSTSTMVSSSSATYADTGLTATITLASTSNKVLVLLVQAGCRKTGNNYMALKLVRNGSDVVQFEAQLAFTNTTLELNVGAAALNYLDSPASVAALTYKTQFNSVAAGASTDVQHPSATLSTIVLIEVVG